MKKIICFLLLALAILPANAQAGDSTKLYFNFGAGTALCFSYFSHNESDHPQANLRKVTPLTFAASFFLEYRLDNVLSLEAGFLRSPEIMKMDFTNDIFNDHYKGSTM